MSMINEYQVVFERCVEFVRDEFAKIRTGRAHVSLVENIEVEAYGTMTPMNQLASISVPEPRTIAIAPWDKSILGSIERALQSSDIGVTPQNDGQVIRVVLPALTEESRKELAKTVNKKAEDGRIRVRNVREDAMRAIDKSVDADEISEDEKFQQRDHIQKMVDEYNEKIEKLREEKEKEVMTV